jgi:glycosyltransferase involved in cell wall biosynthesis
MPSGQPWPKISIVTPSYNQGQYIEETIRSVIMQGYPNLEYIVIDGGSTDNTVDIIKKYDKDIAYWISEKDRGQTHALNKGFERATGDILAYINSDDVYMPYTFCIVAEIMTRWDIKWLTGIRSHLNDRGSISTVKNSPRVFNQFLYSKGFNLSGLLGFNQQVSTFWHRSLTENLKWNEKLNCCMDIDIWLQISKRTELYFVNSILGLMRQHKDQKSKTICNDLKEIESRYLEYGLFSPFKRRALYVLMKTPGVRSILRNFWCDGKFKVITWSIDKSDWDIQIKSAY